MALSAFASFCRGAERGRFPQLRDRSDLWRLLVALTLRKARRLARDERRQKRGGSAAADADVALDQLVGNEPTPEFAAEVAEECRRLLDLLSDSELRMIALLKMESYTNAEIAVRRNCALSTVERRLRLIRRTWEQEDAP